MTEVTDLEKACWRVWYRLKREGPEPPKSTRTSARIEVETFYDAIQLLTRLGVIEEVEESDGPTQYRAVSDEVPLIPVFG